eukprot:29496-Pelagococcus_subviridis.AAC.7
MMRSRTTERDAPLSPRRRSRSRRAEPPLVALLRRHLHRGQSNRYLHQQRRGRVAVAVAVAVRLWRVVQRARVDVRRARRARQRRRRLPLRQPAHPLALAPQRLREPRVSARQRAPRGGAVRVVTPARGPDVSRQTERRRRRRLRRRLRRDAFYHLKHHPAAGEIQIRGSQLRVHRARVRRERGDVRARGAQPLREPPRVEHVRELRVEGGVERRQVELKGIEVGD